MTYFSDQIKNVSKTFVIKLYEIAKQYSFMSLTRVEESIGLSPITYEQELLGSRDSQGDFRREPTLDEATKTQTFENIPSHTRSVADMKKHDEALKQEASGNIPQSQNATNMRKNRRRKANIVRRQNKRTIAGILSERNRERQKHLSNFQRHMPTTTNVINRTATRNQAHRRGPYISRSNDAAVARESQQPHMGHDGECQSEEWNLLNQDHEHLWTE